MLAQNPGHNTTIFKIPTFLANLFMNFKLCFISVIDMVNMGNR